jgi:hypothetical protein
MLDLFMNYISVCCASSLLILVASLFVEEFEVVLERSLNQPFDSLTDIVFWPLRLMAFNYFMLRYGKLP